MFNPLILLLGFGLSVPALAQFGPPRRDFPPGFLESLTPEMVVDMPPQMLASLPPEVLYPMIPDIVAGMPPELRAQLPPELLHVLPFERRDVALPKNLENTPNPPNPPSSPNPPFPEVPRIPKHFEHKVNAMLEITVPFGQSKKANGTSRCKDMTILFPILPKGSKIKACDVRFRFGDTASGVGIDWPLTRWLPKKSNGTASDGFVKLTSASHAASSPATSASGASSSAISATVAPATESASIMTYVPKIMKRVDGFCWNHKCHTDQPHQPFAYRKKTSSTFGTPSTSASATSSSPAYQTLSATQTVPTTSASHRLAARAPSAAMRTACIGNECYPVITAPAYPEDNIPIVRLSSAQYDDGVWWIRD